uniref:Uncharacterized protein n=1 Tax=Anguilla anguilla TaxID=7936 RepID=A0A0E9P9I8_ANGAN
MVFKNAVRNIGCSNRMIIGFNWLLINIIQLGFILCLRQ